MTEDKAKTKWCPFVRYTADSEGDVASNRCSNFIVELDIATDASSCIGSQCMAWRWNQSPTDNAQRQQQASDPLGQLRGPHGYCGLAGK